MKKTLDPHAILDRQVKDQVFLKMPHSPHSQRREFLGSTEYAEVRIMREFEEGAASFPKESSSRAQAAIFTDVRKVPDQIAPCGGPYNSSGHPRLTLLPGSQEGKPGALDLGPIVVRHFACLAARVSFLDEGIDALLPVVVHRNRLPNAIPEAKKEFGRFLKEFFTSGELPALNSLIDAFLEVGWQCDIHIAVLLTAFYARKLFLFTFDFFEGTDPQILQIQV